MLLILNNATIKNIYPKCFDILLWLPANAPHRTGGTGANRDP